MTKRLPAAEDGAAQKNAEAKPSARKAAPKRKAISRQVSRAKILKEESETSIPSLWEELIEKIANPQVDRILAGQIEPWARLAAPPSARMRAALRLACLGGHGLPGVLGIVLGPLESADDEAGALALGAQQRLSLAMALLDSDDDVAKGSLGQRLVSIGRQEALCSILEALGAERINAPVRQARGMTLLEWMMKKKPAASWALPSLAKMGMSMACGKGGITAAHLAIKGWEKSQPQESLLAALAAGAPVEATGEAGSPLDMAIHTLLDKPCFLHWNISLDWAQILIDHGASANEAAGADGQTAMHTAMKMMPPKGNLREKAHVEIVKMLDAAGANWKAADHWGSVPIHGACDLERLPWLDLVRDKDAGWGTRNLAGKTVFDLLAKAAEGQPKIWDHLASTSIPQAFLAIASGKGLPEQAAAGEAGPTAMDRGFLDWLGALPQDEAEKITSVAKKSCESHLERERLAMLAADSVPANAKIFLELWAGDQNRCGALGAFNHASAIDRKKSSERSEDLGKAASALLTSANAWMGQKSVSWHDVFEDEKPEALLALNFWSSHDASKPSAEQILDALAKALLTNGARDALDAVGGVGSRSAWAWENREQSLPGARVILNQRRESLAELEKKNKASGGVGEPQELGAWKLGGRLLQALDSAPLSIVQRAVGSGAAQAKPLSPEWEVFSAANFREFEKLGENAKDNELAEKFIKKSGRGSRIFGLKKPLALAQKILDGLEDLRVDFPHFGEVLDHIEDHCSLQMAGDGSFFLPPMLLVGGPGVGKTFFFQKVSELVATSYKVLHMESMTGGFVITGLAPQWSTGSAGCVFELLTSGSTANPIILLDEIDKCSSGGNHPVESVLLPLLEPHSAMEFQDEGLPLKMDARRICWVATANQLQNVSVPIRSRLDVFEVRSPNAFERRSLSLSVYKSLIKAHEWGSKMSDELSDDVLARASEAQGPGATRNLRRAMTTACAKAIRSGRDFLILDDLPNGASNKPALWNAALGEKQDRAA